MNNTIKVEKTAQNIEKDSRNNNFSMIRLAATVFVFAGHMGVLRGAQPPLFGSFSLHELGVGMLFLISGYLITMSWLSDSDPICYGIRRFFRLWPPFTVMILIMIFAAGPLLSNLGIQGYFQSGYKAYLHNLRFFITYSLPGVFSGLPCPNTVNGALWTMPVEAFLYLLTPVLLIVFRVKSRSRRSFYFMAAFTAASVAFDIYLRIFCSNAVVVFYGADCIAAYHLMVFYMIGILYTYREMKKYLNIQIGCAAMCLLLLFQFAAGPLQYLLLYIILPYFVFSFVFAVNPVFCKMERRMELSYGIYLYGFFFQQCIVSLNQRYEINLSYLEAFVLSALPTLAAAVLSYFLVEKPAQRFSRCLIRKRKTDNM